MEENKELEQEMAEAAEEVVEETVEEAAEETSEEAIEEEITRLNQAYANATEESERRAIAKQLSLCVQKRNALKKA